MGINGCYGTPWSEELDGKKLHGELCGEYDLEPRGSVFFLYTVSKSHTALPGIYKCGIMLVLKGRCSCMIPRTADITRVRDP